jgi:hypothetical protein
MHNYPYANQAYTNDDVIKAYNNLKKNKIIKIDKSNKDNGIKNYKGDKYQTKLFIKEPLTLVIDMSYGDYKNNYIWLTDYFVEEARMDCNSEKKGSMIDTYNKIQNKLPNDKKIARKMLLNNISSWCGVYPVNVAYSIYKIFKPKKILDMSAGWGDRLIASTMYNPELYVGIDPNTKLVNGYKKIIETFVPEKFRNNYQMICDAFEDSKLDPEIKFDLMFSSPPFFIAEHYSNDDKQSFNRYDNIEKWLNNFMFPSLKKIWGLLNDNGYLAIDINDVTVDNQVINYVEKINSYIDTLFNAEYQGVIKWKYKGKNNAIPIWIWKKIA